MSISIEMRTMPTHTIMHLTAEGPRVSLEAWASDEADKQALRDVFKGLSEGDRVLVEVHGARGCHFMCGIRKMSKLEMYEEELLRPGNRVLVPHLILSKTSTP